MCMQHVGPQHATTALLHGIATCSIVASTYVQLGFGIQEASVLGSVRLS